MINAYDLAHIVTHHVNQMGDSVSHKKLQKLLYYVESWHLVHFGIPILDEDFQAWVHGPVLPSLFQYLNKKNVGFNNLGVINDEGYDTIEATIRGIIARNGLTGNQLELITSVLNKYGVLTSMELEMLSHSEAPWIEARNGLPPHASCKNIIPKARMKEFYAALL